MTTAAHGWRRPGWWMGAQRLGEWVGGQVNVWENKEADRWAICGPW